MFNTKLFLHILQSILSVSKGEHTYVKSIKLVIINQRLLKHSTYCQQLHTLVQEQTKKSIDPLPTSFNKTVLIHAYKNFRMPKSPFEQKLEQIKYHFFHI